MAIGLDADWNRIDVGLGVDWAQEGGRIFAAWPWRTAIWSRTTRTQGGAEVGCREPLGAFMAPGESAYHPSGHGVWGIGA